MVDSLTVGRKHNNLLNNIMSITFPTAPKLGDDFLATNGSTYIWMGNRWSGAQAILTGQAQPFFDGGDSSPYNSSIDNTLEGGVTNIIGAN